MIWLLALVFVALQVADWMLTGTILELGGQELNPAMRWVLRAMGLAGLLAVKIVAAVAVAAMCIYYNLQWVLAGICALYLGVCIWNARVLHRMN